MPLSRTVPVSTSCTGTAISKHGSNFTIRKVNEVPLSILNIVESGGIDYTAAAYLWICVEYGMSMFVSGETASGKDERS